MERERCSSPSTKHPVARWLTATMAVVVLGSLVLLGVHIPPYGLARYRGKRTDLHGAVLIFAPLHGADLEGANLQDAHLGSADLSGATLEQANLSGANLSGARLQLAHLKEANLQYSHLVGASLVRTQLGMANLQQAD